MRPTPGIWPESDRHGIVSGIIIRPHFRPSTALLDCEKVILRWPGPFGTGFLSPQPPGVVGIGPVRRIVYPHTGPTKVGPFLFGLSILIGALSIRRQALPQHDNTPAYPELDIVIADTAVPIEIDAVRDDDTIAPPVKRKR
jgi:hypothetical protein